MKIDKIIQETLNKNKLVKVNEKIYLTTYQIEILKKYQIPYESCNTINEIVYYMQELLEDEEYEDLENVSLSLSEMDYYHYYKK